MRNYVNSLIKKISFFCELRRSKHLLFDIEQFLSSKGVRLLYVALPQADKIKGLTDFEKERISSWCFDFNKYSE